MLMVFSIACFLVFCAALVYLARWWFSFDRGPFVKIVAFKFDPNKPMIPGLLNEDDRFQAAHEVWENVWGDEP